MIEISVYLCVFSVVLCVPKRIMNKVEQVDVLIIGSGPAGMSTALHLVKADVGWARRVVVIDKAVHPREKLCAGGVTRPGASVLARLRLSSKPPSYPVNEARLVYQDQGFAVQDRPLFRVFRRDEFDHWLVKEGEQHGVCIRQGEALKDITVHDSYVEVVTEKATIHAKVVVAADGSRSLVRQRLKWNDNGRMARLLEVITPEVVEERPEFRDNIAVFDFSRMAAGLQGYYWEFPSLVKGKPFMNRGVFDSRIRPERPRVALKEELRVAMSKRERDLDACELKGHPIYWFDKNASFSRPRIILAGDAAGVDPLFGEGISFALAYGEVAASALVDAFEKNEFSFANYRGRVLAHPILKQLRLRAFLARIAYRLKSPRFLYWCWRLSPLLLRFLARYNSNYVPVKRLRLAKIS